MKKLNILFTILALTFCLTSAYAQKATIRGNVYDKSTGEPVIFTTVYLEGTAYGTSTDINGFFSIAKIPKGNYTLMVTGIGLDTIKMPIEIVKENQIVSKNLYLTKSNLALQQVDVSAAREEKTTQAQVSTIKLTPETITRLPSVGGEPDLAQYLQVVPGVIFTGDQGGQLYIRGGSPVQTKVLLDGMVIYNPFHSIGLFSVFDNDIIKNVDIYTGGFNAQYGGRVSAVMDITTRDGNRKNISGNVSASPFLAKLELEGPIIKQKEDGGSLTYVLSSRNSYLDKTSPTLYKYVDGGKLPYAFNDVYAKLAYNTKNGSKVSFFGFSNNDRASFQGLADFKWKSWGAGSNFIIVPGNSNTIINGTIGYSKYDINMLQADNQPRKSSVGGFNVGLDFTYFVKAGELRYGFNINGYATNFSFFNSAGTISSQQANSTEMGLYVKFRKVVGKVLVLEPGVRFDYYASLGAISPEPRLDAKVNITDWLRLKLATGLYSQNLISTKADKDVVDLFTGFLFAPDETLLKPNGSESGSKLQRSFHGIFGVELDIAKHIEFTIEPYYKRYLQLINLNRYKQFVTESNYLTETGNAYGIDFLVKYSNKNLFVWVAYSLSRVELYDGKETFTPFYDRTHNLNMVVSYRFGKKSSWEAGARWNLGSGFPFTRTQGFYEDLSFLNGVGTNYTTQNGTLGIKYEDQTNVGRLPWYHRLDLSISKKFQFGERVSLKIEASVSNVYDRNNIFYFDRVKYERVNQLPILPSLALSLSF